MCVSFPTDDLHKLQWIDEAYLDAFEVSVDASDTFAGPIVDEGEEVGTDAVINESGREAERMLGALRVKGTTERVDDSDDDDVGTSARLHQQGTTSISNHRKTKACQYLDGVSLSEGWIEVATDCNTAGGAGEMGDGRVEDDVDVRADILPRVEGLDELEFGEDEVGVDG